MPPESRKRAKPSSDSDSISYFNSTTSIPLKRAQARCNLEGFPSLPPELLHKIAGYFPQIHVNDILVNWTRVGGYDGAPDYKSRFTALRSLSQTCRDLREFYLPLLWEQFEVCLVSGSQWFRDLGNALERKSKGMLKSEHLWPYVRIVTVIFTGYKARTVLAPFVKMLQSLPNVHTLQIPHTWSEMTTALKETFKGSSFPSIRTMIMPDCAHNILRCCPGIESVTCNGDDGGVYLASAVASAGWSKLEVIRYVSPSPAVLERLIKLNPPLRCVRVKADEAAIRKFAYFPSLRTIEIECLETTSDIPNLVRVAKEVLQACTKYVPATNPQRARENPSVGRDTRENLVDLYTDPRAVKVRYLSRQFSRYASRQSPFLYVPVKIDVFPV